MNEEELITNIKNGVNVQESYLQLYTLNKPYIYRIAKRFLKFTSLEDLMQEAYFALVSAVEHYDKTQEVKFSSFLMVCVRQKLRRYCLENECAIRIPEYAIGKLGKQKKIVNEYYTEHGTTPSDSVLSGSLGVNSKMLHDIKKLALFDCVASLDSPCGGENEDIVIRDTIQAVNVDVEADVMRKHDFEIMKQGLDKALDTIPDIQKKIIIENCLQGISLKELAEREGISVGTAYSKKKQTLSVLSKQEPLKQYYELYIAPTSVRNVGVAEFRRTWTSSTEKQALRNLRYKNHVPWYKQ